ncbi:MAG: TolC family protein, partial [Deltaproteobacteria bacterium]
MKKNILMLSLILLSGLFVATTCPADELTIDEVVRQVLDHNERVEAKSELVAAARAEVKASRGERLFRLDAESRLDYLKDEPFERFNGTPILVNDDHTAHHQLTLTQPLFTGFALSTRQQLAELEVDSARLELEQVRADLALEARLAALDLLRRQALLELARNQYDQYLRHRDDAVALEQQGVIARADLLKAEVALAAADQQKTRAEADVSLAQSRLNQLMGRPESAPVRLAAPSAPADSNPDLALLQDQAVRRRPVMRQLNLAIAKAEKAVRLARATFYPQAALVAAYQRDGQDLLAEENDYRNDENAVVGLRLSWNLFHGG